MSEQLKVIAGSIAAFSVFVALAARYVDPEAVGAAPMQRQVEPPMAYKVEPVVVTRITLGQALVQRGRFTQPVGAAADPITPFTADDDWVQDITIYLLNRTNQPIVYGSFTISFPETTDSAAHFRAGLSLTIGRIPESATIELDGAPIRRPPESQPILFRPGQEMAIHLGDYIDRIKARVEPVTPLARLTTMHVILGRFFFSEGMQWNGGYRLLDPGSSTWRRMAPDYFPGDLDRRWPGRPGWPEQR